MKRPTRDRRYAIGNYRSKYYEAETAGGVTIGAHYAVEIMTSEGWRLLAVHPDLISANTDRDERRDKRLLANLTQPITA